MNHKALLGIALLVGGLILLYFGYTASESVTEGVSQPLWVGAQLLLARRVEVGKKVVIQGCWLDWPKIRASLVEEIRDVLPDATLEPVTDHSHARIGRMLATLPADGPTGTVFWDEKPYALFN